MRLREITLSDKERLLDEIAGNPFTGNFYKFYLHHQKFTNNFSIPVNKKYDPERIRSIMYLLKIYDDIIIKQHSNRSQLVSMITELMEYFK